METKEQARESLEDAVHRALEAGMTKEEVVAEVKYAIEIHEDE